MGGLLSNTPFGQREGNPWYQTGKLAMPNGVSMAELIQFLMSRGLLQPKPAFGQIGAMPPDAAPDITADEIAKRPRTVKTRREQMNEQLDY